MQNLMNKKFPNRIQRRSASLSQSKHSAHEPFSAISTFRTINQQKNSILANSNDKDQIHMKMNAFFFFCRQLVRKKDRFEELSKPKGNSCEKINHNKTFRKIQSKQRQKKNQSKLSSKRQSKINKTISFSFNQTIKTTINSRFKPIGNQDEFDLRNEEFKRRHESLKHYQKPSLEQITGIEKNTIVGNPLNKLSINEIYQIRKNQLQTKKLFREILSKGQAVSNEFRESQQFKKSSLIKPHLDYSSSQKMQQIQAIDEIFDRKTVEKYQKLLDTIKRSEKYELELYDDYDQTLTQRNPIYKRRRPQKNKILANYAQEWR